MKNFYETYYSLRVRFIRKSLVLILFLFCLLIAAYDSAAQGEFITTWKTDNPGTSSDNQITIPTTGTGYNYTVDWGDGNSNTNVTGNITHTYATPGTYTVEITGDFPRIFFNNEGDKDKIIAINQWGTQAWSSMRGAFFGATNVEGLATDAPDLSNVTDMSRMFFLTNAFSQDLNDWDLSNVTVLDFMFASSAFNGNVSNWDVSNVTRMEQVFSGASVFNQDISNWDVSNATSVGGMFRNATAFNQDISGWNFASTSTLNWMFWNATSFNQDISSWDVSGITSMNRMFNNASAFDQNLSNWDVSNVTSMEEMFDDSGLSSFNYDQTLRGWSNLSLQSDVQLGAINVAYCTTNGRQQLIDNFNWTINGDAQRADCPFVTTWETTTSDEQITIPTTGTGYDYTVDWGDGTIENNFTGDASHTYTDAGVHTVSIIGDFPRINFANAGDKDKILTVEQWGDIQWTSMEDAFFGCSNMNVEAADAPDLSSATSLYRMFGFASSFNGAIGHWDVSTITNMDALFAAADIFNQDISDWDVGNVTSFSLMFDNADVFNQDISNWVVSSATDMSFMFRSAGAFNQDISNWDVGGVENMLALFEDARSFNQDLSQWDVAGASDMARMFDHSNLSRINYDKMLQAWSQLPLASDVVLGADGIDYCAGSSARQSIIDNFNWTINDGALSCPAVNIPDANFKAALLADATINTVDDGEITIDEAENVNELQLSNLGIENLTGIESFTNLTILGLDNNNITSADLTSNTLLERVFMNSNSGLASVDVTGLTELDNLQVKNGSLTAIDVTTNTKLRFFEFYNNDIGSIDLSNNPDLISVNFSLNNLTELDVSNNLELQTLNFWNNQVTTPLDLSNHPNIRTVQFLSNQISEVNLANGFNENITLINGGNNPATCIQVDDPAYSRANWANKFDADDEFKFSCDPNEIISIPDANFKAALLANTEINTTDDGEITVGEADSFAGALNVASSEITDMSGIEFFRNITSLSFGDNDIVSLDLSNNTKLTSISGGSLFELTDLNLGNNEIITSIGLARTKLTSLDLTPYSSLASVTLNYNNQLTSLDISGLTNLNRLTSQFGVLTGLDVSTNTALTWLELTGNDITSLDITGLPDLVFLEIDGNPIGQVDLTANTKLSTLGISNCGLTSLNVSHMNGLQYLYANNNELVGMDLSNNPSLRIVRLQNNLLEGLNIRNGNNEIITEYNTSNNLNLTCVSVDDPLYSVENWENVDDPAIFKFSCDPNDIVNIPDANFKAALLADASINTTDDGEITYGEAEAFTETIDVTNSSITDLTGVEAFSSLTELLIGSNNITNLDLRYNSALEKLTANQTGIQAVQFGSNTNLSNVIIWGNELNSVDVSGLSGLQSLLVSFNNLTELDITANPDLFNLNFSDNPITQIDLSQSSEMAYLYANSSALTSLDVSNNPKLFELWIIDVGLSTIDVTNNPALESIIAGGNSFTSLDVSQNAALKRFQLNDNSLSEVDLSNNPLLTDVRLANNDLSNLNLANGANTSIINLEATGNSNLTCITVDDVSYAETNFTNIDEGASFSTNCSNIETDITGMELNEQVAPAVIDTDNHTVLIEVTVGTDLTDLTFAVSVSPGATYFTEGTDFTNPVIFTVVAENPNVVQEWTVTIREENVAPTDIALSATTIDENNAIDAVIGTFTSTDANSSASHTYSLIAGTGDENNASFSISDGELIALEVFDFETKDSYSIRVQTDDGRGGVFSKAISISIGNIPSEITAIDLSANTINENEPIQFVIGTLTTSGSDLSGSYTYSLVAGEGDADNASFDITNGQLINLAVFNFEEQDSYDVRIESNDGSVTFEQAFTITVNDVSEAPTDISLEGGEIAENNTVGDILGSFSAVDEDENETYTFSLVEGEGADDNASFSITNTNELSANEVFDFENKSTYSIRVAVNDGNEGTFQKAFAISIINENESIFVANPIADLTLNERFGTEEIDLSSTFSDEDGDPLTFTVASSDETVVIGSVDASTLTVTEIGLGTSTITVSAADGKGASVSDEFTFTVSAAPNNPPVVANEIADQSEVAGFGSIEIDFSSKFSDEDGDPLTYTALSSNENVVTTQVAGDLLIITEVGVGESTITLTATDGNGGSISVVFLVTVTEAILALEDKISFKAYPNPVIDLLTIQSEKEVVVQLLNMDGKVLDSSQGRTIQLDMSKYAHGVYLLRLHQEGETISERILKNN